MASEALSIRDVDTYYGDSHVLHGVGFALQAGRLLGLLGRNGAGKTTCMATIMGFLRPRRGTIALFGENVAGLVPEAIARKGICLVPQGRRVFRSLTVRENLDVAAQKRADGGAWSADRVFALFPRLKERHAQNVWQTCWPPPKCAPSTPPNTDARSCRRRRRPNASTLLPM